MTDGMSSMLRLRTMPLITTHRPLVALLRGIGAPNAGAVVALYRDDARQPLIERQRRIAFLGLVVGLNGHAWTDTNPIMRTTSKSRT